MREAEVGGDGGKPELSHDLLISFETEIAAEAYLDEVVEETERGIAQRERERDERERRPLRRADHDEGQQEDDPAHRGSARFVLVLSDVAKHGLPRFQPS